MKVENIEDARQWLSLYSRWETTWDEFLRHRTYANAHNASPTHAKTTLDRNGRPRTWWYTHRELRAARSLYRNLIKNNSLFTWIDPQIIALTHTGTPLPRTTSPLEGGPNRAVKELLRLHRGMPIEHARRAVEWLLNAHTEHPHDPWTLTKPEHWNTPTQRTRATTPERLGPAAYDTAYSPEDGNGIQKGWGGRNR